jgi:hypothetical protein
MAGNGLRRGSGESAEFPTGVKEVGSSPLLVIQVHGSKIATSEERVANWKILVHQWRNEHSFRDELSHHLVFTKNDEEPHPLSRQTVLC